jgi:hypothetical protein
MSSFYALAGSAECWGIQILITIRYFNSFGFFGGYPVVRTACQGWIWGGGGAVVDGRAAHMTDTTRQPAPEHLPYQIMLDPLLHAMHLQLSILYLYASRNFRLYTTSIPGEWRGSVVYIASVALVKLKSIFLRSSFWPAWIGHTKLWSDKW